MDLTKIVGLTEEQQAAITAQYNAETEGLKNKNSELLTEKKNVQQLAAEKERSLEDARLAASKAEEERLKMSGDMDGLKTLYEQQIAEATATANEQAKKAQDALLSRDKNSVLNSALNLIHDDYKEISTSLLSNMLKIGYNDQGGTLTTFEHEGKVVASSVDEFKSWASEQGAFKKILNGVDSSGANTNQSRGSASTTNKNYSELSLAERAKLNNK